MKRYTAFCMAIGIFLIYAAGIGLAHFNTIIPDETDVRRGKAVNFTYFWGHPYEHIVFDTEMPESLKVLTPDSKTEDIKPEKSGQQLKFSYKPTQLGDHILYCDAPAYFIEEEELFWQDHVKQVIHVMAQSGWDRKTGQVIEIVPLIRPYGIEPGFVFVGQALLEGKPLEGAAVEIEKYWPKGPHEDDLPDEAMITRVAKTGPNGLIMYTLDEPGWWVISVATKHGEMKHDGKSYPVEVRGLFWIHVEEAFIQRIR
jgi:cobalt/nickel transport protein